MREIVWRPGSELYEYPVGSIVTGVSLTEREIARVVAYGEGFVERGDTAWLVSLDRIMSEYDPAKDHPVYYCSRHKKLEDGSHRILARKRKGITTVDVQMGGGCWRSVKLGSDDAILSRCRAAIGGDGKDYNWVSACHRLKWPEINGRVDFLDKSVLDVGCQSGFSSFMAYMRGAHPIHGIDTRPALIEICKIVRKQLKVDVAEQEFEVAGAEGDYGEHDVTIFMGLPHYFKPGVYERLIDKFARLSRETLILELRVSLALDPVLTVRGPQTLASESWLRQRLGGLGFSTENHIIKRRELESRQVWICKRERVT